MIHECSCQQVILGISMREVVQIPFKHVNTITSNGYSGLRMLNWSEDRWRHSTFDEPSTWKLTRINLDGLCEKRPFKQGRAVPEWHHGSQRNCFRTVFFSFKVQLHRRNLHGSHVIHGHPKPSFEVLPELTNSHPSIFLMVGVLVVWCPAIVIHPLPA